eukprot:3547487-Amphidinium_carterae.1
MAPSALFPLRELAKLDEADRVGYTMPLESVLFHRLLIHLAFLAGVELEGPRYLEQACRGLTQATVMEMLEQDWSLWDSNYEHILRSS